MSVMPDMWPTQIEAVKFCSEHPAAMLDMGMGCGKTRVAIEVIKRQASRVLVVCPKAVVPVWPREISKYAGDTAWETLPKYPKCTVRDFATRANEMLREPSNGCIKVVIINYEAAWRNPLGDVLYHAAKDGFLDMVILDESHRAKAAGSKVSKFLAMLGRHVVYKLCLSGTPMANSPLDVYGQYRFLDREIFGTNHERFLQKYAVMGGPERRFIVGYKNQQDLNDRFQSIAYSCKIDDIADRAKLPEQLPDMTLPVRLPVRDMCTMKQLGREFVAECGEGFAVASNVLVRLLRMQQITSGFCRVTEGPGEDEEERDLNTAKADALLDWAHDLDPEERLVVFCVFQHDLNTLRSLSDILRRPFFELSGREHRADDWKASEGGLLAVQIQAGAEGVDLTAANRAVYFSLPHSLALYDQSRARLHRPGQTRPVQFIHLLAENTIDESMYGSLVAKRDVIDAVRSGEFDFGFLRK